MDPNIDVWFKCEIRYSCSLNHGEGSLSRFSFFLDQIICGTDPPLISSSIPNTSFCNRLFSCLVV